MWPTVSTKPHCPTCFGSGFVTVYGATSAGRRRCKCLGDRDAHITIARSTPRNSLGCFTTSTFTTEPGA